MAENRLTFQRWETSETVINPSLPSESRAMETQLCKKWPVPDTHRLACCCCRLASSSCSSGRASLRGCRSPTTTMALRFRSSRSFCSASFMASISEGRQENMTIKPRSPPPQRPPMPRHPPSCVHPEACSLPQNTSVLCYPAVTCSVPLKNWGAGQL